MTTSNIGPDTSLAASTSQHGSEAPFDEVSPQGTANPGLDLADSASLDTGTPPHTGPSSLKYPSPDANNPSGSKRKEEDRDHSSDAEAQTHDKKKLKQDNLDERASSLITPRHTPDAAGVESLVNEPQRSGSPGLEDGLTHSKTDSSQSAPSLPNTPSLPKITVDLPPSITPPPRSHTAPPTSPIIASVSSRAHHFPPPSSLPPNPEPLHTYSCPICFSSPTNATLTPCGHIMCGECLFTAVGAAAARMGITALAARCPVCRAPIPRWDGRGGGVIGLQPRVVITI
ncbi:hypothetical protein DFH94DRAFT_688394 [Russula ochroleuca]|uniref:RING-type domain-containing protein n=1 Tax=Russula ochroleuca TaxID=152965 RepID=A0A9P5N4T1_9AGAM|nr:hypothetical protein DFH94DRAFT_688394 [Russula ochroleuca]